MERCSFVALVVVSDRLQGQNGGQQCFVQGDGLESAHPDDARGNSRLVKDDEADTVNQRASVVALLARTPEYGHELLTVYVPVAVSAALAQTRRDHGKLTFEVDSSKLRRLATVLGLDQRRCLVLGHIGDFDSVDLTTGWYAGLIHKGEMAVSYHPARADLNLADRILGIHDETAYRTGVRGSRPETHCTGELC